MLFLLTLLCSFLPVYLVSLYLLMIQASVENLVSFLLFIMVLVLG